MNNNEVKSNVKSNNYYVRKPGLTVDSVFLEAVNKLMEVWDVCGLNRINYLVEILFQMRDIDKKDKEACNYLIDLFRSSKTNFVVKGRWFDTEYTGKLIWLLFLLKGEQRYKIIKEILPMLKDKKLVMEMLVVNEYATIQDIKDAFQYGIPIDKSSISAFKKVLFKEYETSHNHFELHDFTYDIVSCIEHSSYMQNTQNVCFMYKEFGLLNRPVIKKSEFIKSKEHIINEDVNDIIEKAKFNAKLLESQAKQNG